LTYQHFEIRTFVQQRGEFCGALTCARDRDGLPRESVTVLASIRYVGYSDWGTKKHRIGHLTAPKLHRLAKRAKFRSARAQMIGDRQPVWPDPCST